MEACEWLERAAGACPEYDETKPKTGWRTNGASNVTAPASLLPHSLNACGRKAGGLVGFPSKGVFQAFSWFVANFDLCSEACLDTLRLAQSGSHT